MIYRLLSAVLLFVIVSDGKAALNGFDNNDIHFPGRHACSADLLKTTLAKKMGIGSARDLFYGTARRHNASIGSLIFNPLPYDVIINEIMADPSPVVGLPDAEWIELKNNSGADINLQGWRVGKPAGLSGPLPSYLLKKDSFVVVTTNNAIGLLQPLAPVIAVSSFPALGNTGDLVYLLAPQGAIVHSVNYTDAWYQNPLKKSGGWTLEMIDNNNPCSGISNWTASTDGRGGTPGKNNATAAVNKDLTLPRLLRAYATDSVNVVLCFSEPLDSVSAAIGARYSISDGIGAPTQVVPLRVVFDRVSLRLGSPLLRNKIYTVSATGLTDCAGNVIGNSNTTLVGLYENLFRHDIVINEVLFNPSPAGNDYVELYNRSNKIINLRKAYIANRNTTAAISSITQISTEDHLLFPRDFMVLTENAALVKNTYVANNPDFFIELNLPSYNDDKGNVILLNEQGIVIDEIPYKDDWHFKLIRDDEGVALERINANDTTADNPQTFDTDEQAANWSSAAASVGYGTPTYKNSQYRIDAAVQGTISCSPEIISPDNDGLDDFASIGYSFPEPGYVANITIFDAAGRPVRYLQRNALAGTTGYFRWDGLGEKHQALPVGIYVIYTSVFNLQGKTKKFKNVVVLARKR